MDAVDATLLDAVGTFLLAETGGVGGKGLGQALSRQDLVNEPADHGVLAGADQVQVLPFDLVHHAVHVCLAHNALHHVAVDHEGGDAVGEALVDHEVPAVGQHRLMEPGNVAQQVVKAAAGDPPGGIQVNAVEGLHDIHVVGNGEVGDFTCSEPLDLYIFAVILADGHGGIDHLGDQQHIVMELFLQLRLLFLQLCQAVRLFLHLLLDSLGLRQLGGVLFGLAHQHADLLAECVSVGAELIRLRNGGPALGVQVQDFVYQGKLGILKLLFDIFTDGIRILPDKFDIQHDDSLLNLLMLHVSRETMASR